MIESEARNFAGSIKKERNALLTKPEKVVSTGVMRKGRGAMKIGTGAGTSRRGDDVRLGDLEEAANSGATKRAESKEIQRGIIRDQVPRLIRKTLLNLMKR